MKSFFILKNVLNLIMIKSSGLLIIYKKKILLAHPSHQKWKGTYTIPKGKIEKGESKINAAIRETEEEVGIKISKSSISKKKHVIEYKTKDGYVYKKLFYYIVKLDNIDDIEIKVDNKEINWAGFLNKKEAEKRIFWRFNEMLDFIKKKKELNILK